VSRLFRVTIPITKPVFGPEELRAVQLPLETGWIVQGPYVKTFEDRFAAFVGASQAVATTSCTTALHLALAALRVTPGDEVIVPAFTWIATANVVEYLGGRPVFCDIDLETFNIDVDQMASLVTPRTVGILPVHLFGLCADMDAVRHVAERNSLWVVEDAACGFGARIRGRHCGTFGTCGCFSFHPRKAITTGEGGMITTASAELATMAASLRDHGATESDLARHVGSAPFRLADYPHLGYNFRMTDIQGALGCAQMDRAEWILAERTRVARAYDERLEPFDWLARPVVPPGYDHGYQSYVCLFRPDAPTLANVDRQGERRNELMAAMEALGIATRPGTHAVAFSRYYRERYSLEPSCFERAYTAESLSLSLPLYPQMTEAEIDLVCSSLGAVMRPGT
jgi:perosamine synthetase